MLFLSFKYLYYFSIASYLVPRNSTLRPAYIYTSTNSISFLTLYDLLLFFIEDTSTRKVYPYLIPLGWGFPIFIPIVTFAIMRDYYVDMSSHCFLSIIGGVMWAFVVPILVILSINFILIIIAIFRLILTGSSKKNNDNREMGKGALVTGIFMTIVLGLPWLCLLFKMTLHYSILEWVFIIVNSLMGIVFFLVVVIRNREVLAIFRKKKRHDISNYHQSQTMNPSKLSNQNSLAHSKFRNSTESIAMKQIEFRNSPIGKYL